MFASVERQTKKGRAFIQTRLPRLRHDQVCLGVCASMKGKASGRLDVYTQGKQESDC